MVEVDWTGEDVLALRVAMKRSRYEFARLVGVTPRTVILWENGRTTRMHAASRRLLDRVLSEADSVVVARFERAIAGPTAPRDAEDTSAALDRIQLGRDIGLDKEVEDDDVRRRLLLACIGAGLAEMSLVEQNFADYIRQAPGCTDESDLMMGRLPLRETAADRAELVERGLQ